MAKFMTFDASSRLSGRYDSDYNSSIPEDAMPVSDETFAATLATTTGYWVLIGDEVVHVVPPPAPPAPPTVLTMRQARLALHQSGLLAAADALIAGMAGPEGEAARIEWEFAQTVERTHPLVAAIAAQIELSPGALDDLFTLGGSL